MYCKIPSNAIIFALPIKRRSHEKQEKSATLDAFSGWGNDSGKYRNRTGCSRRSRNTAALYPPSGQHPYDFTAT
jgi:hypothetical protein